MSTAVRWLGLDESRWARVGPQSLWSATAIVVVASSLLALTRFGGLASSAPRAFTRLALVGVWGWIGLALSIWAAAFGLLRERSGLRQTVAFVGLAHVPLLALSLVVFVSAVMAELLGPGLVTAVFVFGLWFPAALVAGVRHVLGADPRRAVATVVVPYAGWLLVVGRHLLGQVEHLL